jgi:hypothetical protein
MAKGVCPECGLAFNPADPMSFVSSPGSCRRRRWVRRGVALVLVIVMVATFVPRGYVGCVIKARGNSGLSRTVEHVRLIPPRWFPMRYPGWTSERDESTGDPDRVRSDPFGVDLSTRKRWFDWTGGTRAGGGVGATANCSEDRPMMINGVVVTRENLGEIARRIAAEIASRHDFGIEIGPADMADKPKFLVPMGP